MIYNQIIETANHAHSLSFLGFDILILFLMGAAILSSLPDR